MDKVYRELHNHIKIWPCTKQDHPPHFHDEIEMIFLQEGTLTACCDGQAYPMKSGDVFLCATNQIHSYKDSSEIYKSILVIIDPALLFGKGKALCDKAPSYPVISDPEKKKMIWMIIEKLSKEQIYMNPESIILILSGIISMILHDVTLQQFSVSNQNIQTLITYCRQHYKEPISIDSMKKQLFMSRSYISHSFSNVLKISLPDYINGLRLNEAVRLLRNTKMNITEISIQSGFPTPRTFNRVFMKEYGISPTQFRKNPKYK